MTTTASLPKIAVLGAGNMGAGLARAWAGTGATVAIGARDAAKARAHGLDDVPVLAVEAAVARADVVVLALPYGATVGVLQALPASALQGKVLVDISNPVTADFQGQQLGTATSAAEAIQAAAPGAYVVKAFNTIFAQLARALAFEAVDAGPLRNSRYLEPVGGMNIQFGFFLGWGPTMAPAWVRT